MTVRSSEILPQTEIDSFPEFTRNFFKKVPPTDQFSFFDYREIIGVKVALPIEIEMNDKLGNWRERLRVYEEEEELRTFIVNAGDEQKTQQKMKETGDTLYTIGYEMGLDKLDEHFINAVADRLKLQGIFYPQLKYRDICAKIMIYGARGV